MSTNKKLLSATLATAAAVSFAIAPITSAVAATHDVHCYGVNSCKGKSECKTAKTSCKGQNSCKGQGYLKKTAKQCEKLGGSTQEPTT